MTKHNDMLPMPERLEPKQTKRSLMTSVRMYFYTLYNAADGKFKAFLSSVGNKDAVTGNRTADRVRAVDMIKASADKGGDSTTSAAKDGDVLQCLSKLMTENGLGLKVRRQQYDQLTRAAR
jgi:hypothetical protein